MDKLTAYRAKRLRLLAAVLLAGMLSSTAAEPPREVAFLSADGRTMLRGFLFEPVSAPPWPAVVMLHGRAGPYSSVARDAYGDPMLLQRHRQWGQFWAERGYLALHVDSFSSRGYPQGFPAGSYSTRPAEVNEQTVRPLDAYGAAAYLRSRSDVIGDRIGLQGWSNGAMAGLATLSEAAPGLRSAAPGSGFRAALLFYPACRIQTRQAYRPYAPVLMFVASRDQEVAPAPCRNLAEQVERRGIEHFEMVWYEGATHSFDDPGRRRQSLEANRMARSDAMQRAAEFFSRHLAP